MAQELTFTNPRSRKAIDANKANLKEKRQKEAGALSEQDGEEVQAARGVNDPALNTATSNQVHVVTKKNRRPAATDEVSTLVSEVQDAFAVPASQTEEQSDEKKVTFVRYGERTRGASVEELGDALTIKRPQIGARFVLPTQTLTADKTDTRGSRTILTESWPLARRLVKRSNSGTMDDSFMIATIERGILLPLQEEFGGSRVDAVDGRLIDRIEEQYGIPGLKKIKQLWTEDLTSESQYEKLLGGIWEKDKAPFVDTVNGLGTPAEASLLDPDVAVHSHAWAQYGALIGSIAALAHSRAADSSLPASIHLTSAYDVWEDITAHEDELASLLSRQALRSMRDRDLTPELLVEYGQFKIENSGKIFLPIDLRVGGDDAVQLTGALGCVVSFLAEPNDTLQHLADFVTCDGDIRSLDWDPIVATCVRETANTWNISVSECFDALTAAMSFGVAFSVSACWYATRSVSLFNNATQRLFDAQAITADSQHVLGLLSQPNVSAAALRAFVLDDERVVITCVEEVINADSLVPDSPYRPFQKEHSVGLVDTDGRTGLKNIFIEPGYVHSVVGASGVGKTTIAREVFLRLSQHFGNTRIIVLRHNEPLEGDGSRRGLAERLGVPESVVEVWKTRTMNPSLIKLVQREIVHSASLRGENAHTVLVVDSATSLITTPAGAANGSMSSGLSKGGVSPLARVGLTQLSQLYCEGVTTLVLFNTPGGSEMEYWTQVHGASTISMYLTTAGIASYRNRLRGVFLGRSEGMTNGSITNEDSSGISSRSTATAFEQTVSTEGEAPWSDLVDSYGILPSLTK